MRHAFLPLLVGAGLAGLASAQNLKSTLFVSGLARPTWIGSAPADAGRMFALEQDGRVRVIQGGTLLAAPFLDLDPIVGSLGNERGLLGLAFDPGYASNGFFYVSYTDNAGASVVARYTNLPPSSNSANAASAQIVFGPLAQPQSNHNGGCLQFGPDGMLYLGLGDGGSANDSGSGHAATGNAQALDTYLGKLLRIDPANPAVAPAGNPFPASAIPLAWALGLRNPWRFCFDAVTGELYVADVGQNAWEELDVLPAGLGGANLGWRCMEGTHCTGLSGCSCAAPSLTLPVHEYAHAQGNCSIIGGVVYRGIGLPALQGTYFFADYCSGRIWSLRMNGGQVTALTDRTAQLAPGGGLAIHNPVAFGADANGEIYVLDQTGGEVFRIEEVCVPPVIYCTAFSNSTGFPANLQVFGNGSFTANNLTLVASSCPAGVSAMFFHGDGQTQVPMGNGLRCVASNLVRLPVITVDAFGDALYHPDLNTMPGIAPGLTKGLQLWYRDPQGGGALFNTTDAVQITFCN